MQTILGIYGIDSCADVLDQVIGRDLSLSVLCVFDSNGNQGTTRGFSNGISLGLQRQGLCVISSAPSLGLFINNGTNRPLWRDQEHQSVEVAKQGAYGSIAAAARPYLPYSADGPTNTAIQAIVDNEPACFLGGVGPGSGVNPNMGTPYVRVQQSTDPVGHDIFERIDIHCPFVKGPGMGSRNMWCRSHNGVGGEFNAGYVGVELNHSAAAFGFDAGFCGSMNGGSPGTAVRAGDVSFDILPFGQNWGYTGEGIALSAHLHYPERPHGYCIGPATIQGATGLHDHAACWNGLQDQAIKAWIFLGALGLGTKNGWLVLWITHGLNNRTPPNDTQQVYKDALDDIIDRFDAMFAAMSAAGEVGANVKGIIVISDVIGFRLPSGNAGLAHCYAASRDKADQRGRMLVPDFGYISAGESTRICTDGSHLNTTADFERRAIENVSRIFLASRKANGLREVA